VNHISQEATDYIVKFEVTSKEYYEKYYTKPEWPGYNSGITIAIGYDLGQTSRSEIQNDWQGIISQDRIDVLLRYSGYKAHQARAKLKAARRDIGEISWEEAYQVFEQHTIPRWEEWTRKGLPNTDLIHPDCFGALVSICYNRGPNWNRGEGKDRYYEMRAIRDHMVNKNFSRIPEEIRDMKRLWNNDGLQKRREEEAQLFERGLEKMA